MRQQLGDLVVFLRRQTREYVLQIGIRIMPIEACRLDQAHDGRRPLAAAQRSGKQPVLAAQCHWPDLVFHPIVVDRHIAIIQVARERLPAF